MSSRTYKDTHKDAYDYPYNELGFEDALAAQAVFREVMNAFAHPLKIYRINRGAAGSSESAPIRGESAPILELCRVFLDNAVSFYVDNDEELAAAIREQTYAATAGLEDAGFVILKDPENFGAWGSIRQGSLVDPHKGATVIVGVPQIAGGTSITAEGPGIDGKATFLMDHVVAGCARIAAGLDREYPKGFELIFVSYEGDICALPRHVRILYEGGGR